MRISIIFVMTRITFMLLLLCICVVAQEKDQLTEDLFINGDNVHNDLGNGFGNYEVKRQYSYITPNNQQVNNYYSAAIHGYEILPPPTSYPTLPQSVFNWYPSESAVVTLTQKPQSTSDSKDDEFTTEKMPATSTEKSIEDYFKEIFKPKSYYEKPLRIGVEELSPNQTPPCLSSENVDVPQEMPVNVRFKISNSIERSETRRTFKTGNYEVKGHYSYIAPNNQHVTVYYSPGVQGYRIWSPPTLPPEDAPVMVRFDVAPFGEGPKELKSRKKANKKFSKKFQNNNINNKDYEILRTKLLQSAIGPRFEDV